MEVILTIVIIAAVIIGDVWIAVDIYKKVYKSEHPDKSVLWWVLLLTLSNIAFALSTIDLWDKLWTVFL